MSRDLEGRLRMHARQYDTVHAPALRAAQRRDEIRGGQIETEHLERIAREDPSELRRERALTLLHCTLSRRRWAARAFEPWIDGAALCHGCGAPLRNHRQLFPDEEQRRRDWLARGGRAPW